MKKIVRISLFVGIFILIISAIMKKNIYDNKTVTEQSADEKQIVKAELEQDTQILKKANKSIKRTKFKSNDEIKDEYGKIETVHLWNGKTYTGAVINSEEVYSIVTVEGLIKIPMKDVKLREIIR